MKRLERRAGSATCYESDDRRGVRPRSPLATKAELRAAVENAGDAPAANGPPPTRSAAPACC
ncbi:MAG: hypothetical protein MZV49_27055 [Rhodopseudomonas palustris]|nr:hypothetical protein [Rhodopseudomonas palustris]